ncbi:hypothetical protein BpHYR1_009338 [Brachionus plicatilis]|uniref:Uncharacterized protein n=1 Tax=Brachionus plicatilis TaxID=10195 RepID=A0A3M7P796_BRAPC|nr:hypothetical protein BpHYR1_009338 [Brachionus plicatilis]
MFFNANITLHCDKLLIKQLFEKIQQQLIKTNFQLILYDLFLGLLTNSSDSHAFYYLKYRISSLNVLWAIK